jgi:hypothetical protein
METVMHNVSLRQMLIGSNSIMISLIAYHAACMLEQRWRKATATASKIRV